MKNPEEDSHRAYGWSRRGDHRHNSHLRVPRLVFRDGRQDFRRRADARATSYNL